MSERIVVRIKAERNVVDITGYVDGDIVVNVHNRINNEWGIHNSRTLPYDFELACLYSECMSQVFDAVTNQKFFFRGTRVRANSTAGFHKGATGTVEFVEPSGQKIWVLRDGSSGPVFYIPSELDII
jgi:hypothetical protein